MFIKVENIKVSDRAPRQQPSRPGRVSSPCPRWHTVTVSLEDAAALHKADPHCPRQQGLCMEKQEAKLRKY